MNKKFTILAILIGIVLSPIIIYTLSFKGIKETPSKQEINKKTPKNNVELSFWLKSKNPYIKNFVKINSSTLNCSVKHFWEAVKEGKDIIPDLIDALLDSTKTQAHSSCKGDYLSIGDIAYFALEEIAVIPLAKIVKQQFCVIGECGSIQNYVLNDKHKFKMYDKIKAFYDTVEYKAIPIDTSYLPQERIDCYQKHSIYY